MPEREEVEINLKTTADLSGANATREALDKLQQQRESGGGGGGGIRRPPTAQEEPEPGDEREAATKFAERQRDAYVEALDKAYDQALARGRQKTAQLLDVGRQAMEGGASFQTATREMRFAAGPESSRSLLDALREARIGVEGYKTGEEKTIQGQQRVGPQITKPEGAVEFDPRLNRYTQYSESGSRRIISNREGELATGRATAAEDAQATADANAEKFRQQTVASELKRQARRSILDEIRGPTQPPPRREEPVVSPAFAAMLKAQQETQQLNLADLIGSDPNVQSRLYGARQQQERTYAAAAARAKREGRSDAFGPQGVGGPETIERLANVGGAGGGGVFNRNTASAVRFGAALAGLGVGISIYTFAGRLLHDVLRGVVDTETAAFQSTKNLTASFGEAGATYSALAKQFAAGQTSGAGVFSRTSTEQAIAGLKPYQDQLGLTTQQLERVTQAAAKLSDIRDIPLTAATEALGQALAGNAGAAEKLGLSINDVQVAARYANGAYATTFQSLTEVEKAAARLSIAEEQLAQQQKAVDPQPLSRALRELGNTWDEFARKAGPGVLGGISEQIIQISKDLDGLVDHPFGVKIEAEWNGGVLAQLRKQLEDFFKLPFDINIKLPSGQTSTPESRLKAGLLPTQEDLDTLSVPANIRRFAESDFYKNAVEAANRAREAQNRAGLAGGAGTVIRKPEGPPEGAIGGLRPAAPLPSVLPTSTRLQDIKEKNDSIAKSMENYGNTVGYATQKLNEMWAIFTQGASAATQRIDQIKNAVTNISALTGTQIAALSERQAEAALIRQKQLEEQTNAQGPLRKALEEQLKGAPPEVAAGIQSQISKLDQLTGAYQTLNRAQQASNSAQLAQQVAQNTLTQIDLQSQARRVDASRRLAELQIESLGHQDGQLSRADKIVDLQRQQADLADRQRVAQRENLDLLDQEIRARQAARPAVYASEDIQFAQRAAQQRAFAIRADVTRGALPASALQELPQIAREMYDLALRAPRAEFEATQAERPGTLIQRQLDEQRDARQINLNVIERQNRSLDDQLIPLQTAQRLTDERTQAIQHQLDLSDALLADQKANATLAVLQAQSITSASQAAAAGAQLWVDLVQQGFTSVQAAQDQLSKTTYPGAAGYTGDLVAPDRQTGRNTKGMVAGGGTNITIQYNGPLTVRSQQDLDELARRSAALALQAINDAARETNTPPAPPVGLVGAYTPE